MSNEETGSQCSDSEEAENEVEQMEKDDTTNIKVEEEGDNVVEDTKEEHNVEENTIEEEDQVDEVVEPLVEQIIHATAPVPEQESTVEDEHEVSETEDANIKVRKEEQNQPELDEDEYVVILDEDEEDTGGRGGGDEQPQCESLSITETPIVQQMIKRDQPEGQIEEVKTLLMEDTDLTTVTEQNIQIQPITTTVPLMTPQSFDNVLSEFKNLQLSRKSDFSQPSPLQQQQQQQQQPLFQQLPSPKIQSQLNYQQPQTFSSRVNPPQSSIYHRNVQNRKQDPLNIFSVQPIVTNFISSSNFAPQRQTQILRSPVRKISASTPYVGSHVIASETGPSLTVLLRRYSSERQWGFTFYGGSEYGCPPFVNKVTKNSLAFQNGLEVGDVIVSICKTLAVGKTHEQLKAELLRAGNELDLVLIRQGVDLQKVTQIVPQVLSASPRSPPPSVTFASPLVTCPEANRQRTGHSLTRGRSFRTVRTKSIRLLEEQLASGQDPSSTLTSKQHFQGARGLSASGAVSSFTKAYGQTGSQGYTGRMSTNQPMNMYQLNAAPPPPSSSSLVTDGQPAYQVYGSQTNIQPNQPFFDRDMVQWAEPVSMGSNPNWDTRSEMGTSWGTQPSPYTMHQPPYQKLNTNPTNNDQAYSQVPYQGQPTQFGAYSGPNHSVWSSRQF